jgi:CheY-like chemotaxis protein
VPHTLLAADDSATIRRVIELTFADRDVHVVTVADGDAAITALGSSTPDIVLADILMPGRSGYDVARHVKGTPDLAHIPVMLLAGAFEPVDHSLATSIGCAGIFTKPLDPQFVIKRVSELLGATQGPAAVTDEPVASTDPDGELSISSDDRSMEPAVETTVPSEPVDAAVELAPAWAASVEIAPLEIVSDPSASSDESVETLVAAGAPAEDITHPVARLEESTAGADGDPSAGELKFTVVKIEDLSKRDTTAPTPPHAFVDVRANDLDAMFTKRSLEGYTVPAPPLVGPNLDADGSIEELHKKLIALRDARSTLQIVEPRPEMPTDERTAPSDARQPSDTVAAGRPVAPASLVNAFSALLAAERSAPGQFTASPPVGTEPLATPAPEELLERVARRALDRLSEDDIRGVVERVVSATAERLVREEIERIKSHIK